MKRRTTLSIAPYYGGKGRMAHFIADRLNYADSDVFVTPFGGMCRVLLNKPRHKEECYNDLNPALTTLMSVLSDRDSASELIHRLYDETVYSEEEFKKQKAIYDLCIYDFEYMERKKLKHLLVEKRVVPAVSANDFIEIILSGFERYIYDEEDTTDQLSKPMSKAYNALRAALIGDPKFMQDFTVQVSRIYDLYKIRLEQGYMLWPRDAGVEYSDIDLAIATFYVFQCSRDGMGQTYSDRKFKDTNHYLSQVMNLYDCAQRLEGVQVYQIDAVDFFRKYTFVDVDTPIESIPSEHHIMNEWINNPRVMMCCDPSYISVEHEAKLLEDINVDAAKSLSDAIKEKYNNRRMPKNLGKVYLSSFAYCDHEKFLRCIQKAQCKILVCNYDLALYNKYLNPEHNWRREEFSTTTTVGGKANNTRTEVIWYNY